LLYFFYIFHILFVFDILVRKQGDTYISIVYVLNYSCPSLDMPPSMTRLGGRETNHILPCSDAFFAATLEALQNPRHSRGFSKNIKKVVEENSSTTFYLYLLS